MQEEAPWWPGAVGYEIYIQSFADASSDGMGDLEGVRRHLPYLADLGVDYLWITPFYPSPQADHGYDVADYRGVDPTYGTLDDFDAVVAEAHGLGLRIVIDIVPNHTSDQHPWFQEAVTSRQADTRDYYVWRDPGPNGEVPNNWVSKFGGSAWTWHEPTGQYYMHTFLPEQPDLNWANARVRDEFDEVLRFWLDRGVDGFRVDTAHLLTEDPHFRDNPRLAVVPDAAGPDAVYHSYEHLHDLDQPDVVDVYRRWHRIVAPRGAMLLGEVYLLQPEQVQRYVADGALDLAFYFPALKARWAADDIREALVRAVTIGRGRLVWPLSSHDDPRAAQRFGGGPVGARRALAYLTLLVGLPGGTCLLQGDELGLSGTVLPIDQLRDPVATRNPGASGRDLSRTPIPWAPGRNFGFTTARPWMPFLDGTSEDDSVAEQQQRADSPLQRTRRLLAARRQIAGLCGGAPLRWLPGDGPVIAYQRGDAVVALNTSGSPQRLDLAARRRLRYLSVDAQPDTDDAVLPADAAAIFELERSGNGTST